MLGGAPENPLNYIYIDPRSCCTEVRRTRPRMLWMQLAIGPPTRSRRRWDAKWAGFQGVQSRNINMCEDMRRWDQIRTWTCRMGQSMFWMGTYDWREHVCHGQTWVVFPWKGMVMNPWTPIGQGFPLWDAWPLIIQRTLTETHTIGQSRTII
jgi:hypothetical protein